MRYELACVAEVGITAPTEDEAWGHAREWAREVTPGLDIPPGAEASLKLTGMVEPLAKGVEGRRWEFFIGYYLPCGHPPPTAIPGPGRRRDGK